MIELRQNVRFALKAEHRLAARLVASKIIDHDRQCTATRLQAQVLSQVNSLHSPFTEWLNDPIPIGDYGRGRYCPHCFL
jgi:hypothetical protein